MCVLWFTAGVGERAVEADKQIGVGAPPESVSREGARDEPASIAHEPGRRYYRPRANMPSHAHPQGTAADTLDRIRRGGTHLILAAQRRLAETKMLLDEGDFQAAMKTAAQLHEKVSALADAEGSLGSVSDARILKCAEIEVGMTLADVGEVTAIEVCPCGQDQCDRIVLIIEEHAVNLPIDAELIVATSVSP
jgi:hypothetical protein